MKKTAPIILLLILFALPAGAQRLKLVRTDVDSSRADFITATYSFGVDIFAEELPNCTGVSFELNYDNAQFIKFSEYGPGEFGEDNVTLVNDPDYLAADVARVMGASVSQDTAGAVGYDNPKVARLEFVVSQQATHDNTVTFSFTTALAAALGDSTAELINLDADPVTFKIRGFVDVWPGDANRDGLVDSKDYGSIMINIGKGSASKNMRSFKRNPASTIWAAQRALAWDKLDATFADCDGNGDVTAADMLVIRLNLTTQSAGKSDETPQGLEPFQRTYAAESTVSRPIEINSPRNFEAVSAEISWGHLENRDEIIGVDRGELFANDPGAEFFCKVDKENYRAHLAFVGSSSVEKALKKGVLAYLVSEGDSPGAPIVENITVLEPNGKIERIETVSSVETNGFKNVNFKLIGYELSADFSEGFAPGTRLQVYDAFGRVVAEARAYGESRISVDVGEFSSGAYFARVVGKSVSETYSFVYLR